MDWDLAVMDAMDDFTKGVVMDKLREGHANAQVAKGHMLTIQEAKITQEMKRLGEISANRNIGGLCPVFEIPTAAVEEWRTHFLLKDRAAGIKHSTGYEFMKDKDWQRYYMKRNPGLVYQEEKRCAQSSIIVPATRWEKVERKAAA